MTYDSKDTIVVSYWAGTVPQITLLHFISFLKFSQGERYVLFLDSRGDFASKVHKDLEWVLSHPSFEILEINLEELLKIHGVPAFSRWSGSIVDRVGRKIIDNYYRLVLHPRNINPLKKMLAPNARKVTDSRLGYTSTHTRLFSGLKDHLTYRADLFRSLILAEHPELNIFYVDLDICFLRSFTAWDWSKSWTSQWGVEEFANTACLFSPKTDVRGRETILKNLRRTASAWPWSLYSKANCDEAGLEIMGIENFDPPWTPESLICGRSDLFFKAGLHAQGTFDELVSGYFLAHWHNQWNVIPEPGSPFKLRLQKFSHSNQDFS